MNKWTLFISSLSLWLVSMTAHATPSVLIFASDPQYPWTPYSDNQQDIPDKTNQQLSRELIEAQYTSIADLRKAHPDQHVPVMINGDMTAYGHGWQRDYLYRTLDAHLGGDYYFGLGNHDYQNNVGNCANNGCARDSLFDLRDRMLNKVDSMALYVEKAGWNETWVGSLAYSKRFGDVQLIQLNNEPTYEASFSSRQRFKTYDFRIKSSLDWLEEQLKQARADNLTILLNMHKPNGWQTSAQDLQRFKAMINTYQVTAVFAGHLHRYSGRYYEADYFGAVPLFLSGSASQRSYLIAEIDRDARHLRVSKVADNDWKNSKELAVIPLPGHQNDLK
ncbi:metallophosphoesterase family protein [Pseudomonas abietaniphila]|uniref:Calcineurin-like phosphoesterase n=1 Tax=Pseudomonas abietaniphila TaxID=89065 RepID=A0A1G8IHB6_9PSED|nr:metallophosphoesterase family protein [Pseudomonas abietaniphila]SDI17920.1 Calcineurin-like phosphoesterase [Pseudomonas abietaniphila]